MIAGTLTPSSANLVPRPKHLGQDDDETRNNASGRTRTDSSGRSAALERAYVHDVYENCEEPVGPLRPRVAQFLASLDPGSIVCDVGCGNGRYLTSCNPFIYTIGVDRCYRLTKVARAKGGEVAICDNLELPFRDESFDAVLSLAVVHHFATTERRVGAIRELARILRIGGRVIITVWALEQRHRRFESQDVLIPWQPPKNRNSNASDDEDDDDYLPPYHAYTEDSTNSSRSAGDGDSSSLSSSSPGESCYSFVRRAIQKLAGGKKHPWFLESWNSKDTKQDSSLDYEDAKDLPIELRRLEDFDDFPEPPLSAGLKSRSLGSILNPPPRTIVRSRSSVPSLGAQIPETKPQPVAVENATSRRPKLVKQKQSLCDEDDFPLVDSTFQTSSVITNESRLLLRKQSSLNEELMAESRLREKERVRKRIQKQMSLNEAFLCRSLFTKRLQVIREGFTTKLKTSTGSLERVTKSGLVKIMQNLKGTNHQGQCYNQNQTKFQGTNIVTKTATTTGTKDNYIMEKTTASSTVTAATNPTVNGDDDQKPRRHSRESGSDSSKDSSLQSDTSIESEDSFASVIYIPRPDQQATITDSTTNSNAKMPSVPTSPLVMPCPTPAHSPAPPRCKMQTKPKETTQFTFEIAQIQKSDDAISSGGKGKGNNSGTIQMIKSEKMKSHQPTKITKQIVKDLPPIPKFKKAPSFPIVRRVSAAPAVPKLMSLEIFNPETDDLDSDSSEPSSPDSIDSVISALKPSVSKSPGDGCSGSEVPPFIEAAAIVVNKLEEAVELVLRESKSSDRISSEMNLDLFTDNDKKNDDFVSRQHLVDFAEKLSAQLLKELDENSDVIAQDDECDLLDDKSDESFFTLDDPYIKKLNGEIRDLNTLREELRERRLMLANLNTTGPHHYHHHHNAHPHHHYHPYQNNNNHSNNNNSTSSVIHEEDESPKNDSISELIDDGPLYSSCSSVIPPDTALLLQQDDDNSPEESFTEIMNNNKLSEIHNVITTMDQKYVVSNNISIGGNRSTINLNNTNNNNINNNNNNNNSNNIMNSKLINNNNHRSSAPTLVDSRQSVDSWGHSNSTASLDSPSVGGAATHHRYYHVFREGELDALINHHVASLHIVSSYYERASWCVVAEKVQVWTI